MYNDPVNDVLPFIEKKSLSDYPISALDELMLLSVNKKEPASFFGSFSRRVLAKNAGDIDLHEIITGCCTIDEVVNKFANGFKRIIRNIQKKPHHYISEIKCGVDFRYDIDLGSMIDGILRLNPDLFKITTDFFTHELLDVDDVKLIEDIINKGEVILKGDDDYDILKYVFREHFILRWTPEEILQGYKHLPGNKWIKLETALKMKAHIKIDVLSLVDGKFIEVTNFFILAKKNKDGSLEAINSDYTSFEGEQLLKQLPDEIEKWYYSDMYYSPLKVIKRLYSLCVVLRDENTLRKVIPILVSNAALLYQIKSEIDTLILVLERSNDKSSHKLINKQLDETRSRIASISEITPKYVLTLNTQIANVMFIHNKHKKALELGKLKKLITPIINYITINMMIKMGLNPPPSNFLPQKKKYSDIIRQPFDNPLNPLKLRLEKLGIRGEGLYQDIMNPYRRRFCNGRARPLLDGEMHWDCGSFIGPGTRIDLDYVRNFPPYNNIDRIAKKHDLDYYEASQHDPQEKAKLIRKADSEFLRDIEEFKSKEPTYYLAGKAGITAKNILENVAPPIAKHLLGKLYGHD